MSDSAAVATALIGKLVGAGALMTLLPDGVHLKEAPQGALRFVIVSLAEHHDVAVFGGRGYEDGLYLVKAVLKDSSAVDADTAAALIDGLLDPQPPLPPATLVVAGYTFGGMWREEHISDSEVDDVDHSIRWQHRGGMYRVMVAPA